MNFLEDSSSCTSTIVLANGYRRCYNFGEFVFYNSPSFLRKSDLTDTYCLVHSWISGCEVLMEVKVFYFISKCLRARGQGGLVKSCFEKAACSLREIKSALSYTVWIGSFCSLWHFEWTQIEGEVEKLNSTRSGCKKLSYCDVISLIDQPVFSFRHFYLIDLNLYLYLFMSVLSN